MKKILLLLLLVALPLCFASTFDEIDTIASDSINKSLQQPFSSLFGSERFDVSFITDNDTVSYYLITDDGFITEAGAGFMENATLTATVELDTVDTILNSENQFDALVQAYEDKEIQIEGKTFTNKVKVGIAKFFATIAGWFV